MWRRRTCRVRYSRTLATACPPDHATAPPLLKFFVKGKAKARERVSFRRVEIALADTSVSDNIYRILKACGYVEARAILKACGYIKGLPVTGFARRVFYAEPLSRYTCKVYCHQEFFALVELLHTSKGGHFQ